MCVDQKLPTTCLDFTKVMLKQGDKNDMIFFSANALLQTHLISIKASSVVFRGTI